MNRTTDKKILILGAGFAGLSASRQLQDFADVTVIAPNASFEFFPNIHELVSGFKSPEDLRLDIREIVEGRRQEFVLERAVHLDRENQVVSTSSGDQYPYDYLIVAMGAVNNDWGIPGVQEYTYPFKTASDCYAIGQKLEDLEDQDSPYSVTIVGGGVEGVEALGEILRKYGKSTNLTVSLVEAQGQLLPNLSGQIHQKILKLCLDFPVSFHFGKRVQQIEGREVALSDGKYLESDLVIWTGGVKSHPKVKSWGLTDRSGWPPVNDFLQSEEDANILIIGDSVDVMGGGEKQAYLALEMGKIAGQNIRSILNETPLKAYKPKSLPSVYTFGNLTCFIVYKGIALSGLPFAGLKEAIYQLNMASMQDVCSRPTQLIGAAGRGVNGALSIVNSFLQSPIPFFSKFRIRLSAQKIMGLNRKL